MNHSAAGGYPGDGVGDDRAWFLVGPTAIGKTAVAEYLSGEDGLALLSADSMLVYRGMSIGTAKPAPDRLQACSYAGVDLVEPTRRFDVAQFMDEARRALRAAASSGTPLAVVGGTGLYVKCLIAGLDDVPGADRVVREQVEALFDEAGVEGLQAALQTEDPERLEALDDPVNPRRLIRALELSRLEAEIPSGWKIPPPHQVAPVVGLRMDRQALRQRIYHRVKEMYRLGLLDEARALRGFGVDLSATAAKAIGYAEAFDHLDGKLSIEEAIHRTMIRTCQLAKRQETFFRNQLPVHWIDVEPDEEAAAIGERVRTAWTELGPTKIQVQGGREHSDDGAGEPAFVYPVVKALPEDQRPREVFERKGAEGMSEAELLALILRTGTKGINAVDLARQLMSHYINLAQMARASVEDLAEFKGIGRTKAQILKATLELGRRQVLEVVDKRPEVRTPEQAAGVMRPLVQDEVQEHFWVLILDTRYRLLRAPVEVSKGIADASLVHPREVFREAIRASATAVILAHNHPSGDVSPSSEDLRITRQLIEAGRVLGIAVLDHIVVGRLSVDDGRDFLSLRESGLVEFEG